MHKGKLYYARAVVILIRIRKPNKLKFTNLSLILKIQVIFE